MRILFTGASSFSGTWFVRELARAGHFVTAILRQPVDSYEGTRGERVKQVAEVANVVAECNFGDDAFLELIAGVQPDVLCHHAADVTNYKSPDFDPNAALSNNTYNLRGVIEALTSVGCQRVLLTGSVFEQGEGAGSEGLPAVSPYGLSKGLTFDYFRFYVELSGLHLGKFVIPNPFGPFEEPRFTQYLIRTWRDGKVAGVNTPAYVRDNIHVELLAQVYSEFCGQLPAEPGFSKINPSGYVESQGAFAERFAAEMRPRLGLACGLELAIQTEFAEPRVRINTDLAAPMISAWNESAAWDELADYYRASFLTES